MLLIEENTVELVTDAMILATKSITDGNGLKIQVSLDRYSVKRSVLDLLRGIAQEPLHFRAPIGPVDGDLTGFMSKGTQSA